VFIVSRHDADKHQPKQTMCHHTEWTRRPLYDKKAILRVETKGRYPDARRCPNIMLAPQLFFFCCRVGEGIKEALLHIFVREHGVHAGPKDYFVVVVVVVVICG
jgi:hypothetical protein